jgi:proteic killer suppression protein
MGAPPRGSLNTRKFRCGAGFGRQLQRLVRPRAGITVDVIIAVRYAARVIQSFRDADTEKVFRRERSRRLPPDVLRRALRKLLLLDAADSLDDLRIPPGNRLERLSGNRKGQHSIRINDQWRICFRWSRGDAYDVEITDYH